MATELTEQAFPLNFSDAFRPIAAEKLLEEMRTADLWSVRERASCAYQTLDESSVAAFASMLANRLSDREGTLEITRTYHDWWKYDACLTAAGKRQMPELCLHITSDHLFQIVRELSGYAKVDEWPEDWLAWYKHDDAFQAQEDAKAEAEEAEAAS